MKKSNTQESASVGSPEEGRREFLKHAGKLAAYTPPTLLALMYPGAHAIASGGSEKPGERKGEGKKVRRMKLKRVKKKILRVKKKIKGNKGKAA